MPKKQDFEKEQVLLSLERTILSKERTVLAEISVLLGFMALGFLIIRFFEDATSKTITIFGFALVIFSVIAMLAAIYNFKKYTVELKRIEKNGKVKLEELE
ncbi:MAG: DUF202 domain-containing protein [Candidatus Diapherotrites archaeon]|uniref:DUF202 domain-containing protein n=1 Tax=Candidatus Iainarchaeum sp. TaxID=3101447 RepID=A0A8T4L4Q2_9ARCH|nr:DUF202 domain-containing protein [Candidatus Diapherotrites archaeon]